MSTGVEDIEESLRILLSTHPGERIMQPSYGCALRRYVFETMSEQILTEMREVIRRAVLFHEPRIVLHEVELEADVESDGLLHLKLDYSVRSTHVRHSLVYPLYSGGTSASGG